MAVEEKPCAKEGLFAADHSKRGKRWITILDPGSNNVTLLEPWEHAVLILCDGTREVSMIAKLLEQGVDSEPVDLKAVQRCIKYFEREKLLEISDKKPSSLPPPGPRTLAEIQLAYREWHKDPVRTGEILLGLLPPPLINPPPDMRAGLSPTVALAEGEEEKKGSVAVGSMLLLAGASESLLSKPTPAGENKPKRSRDREPHTLIGSLASEVSLPAPAGVAIVEPGGFEESDIAKLLAHVEDDVREVESREAAAQKTRTPSGGAGKPVSGEAIPPPTRELRRAPNKVEIEPEPLVKKAHEAEKRAHEMMSDGNISRSIVLPETALGPTRVGPPAQPQPKEVSAKLLLPPKRAASPSDEDTARLIKIDPRKPSLSIGAIVEDAASPTEGPTEGLVRAFGIDEVARDVVVETMAMRGKRRPRVEVSSEEQQTVELDANHAPDGLPPAAREVFDLLRRAGMRARHHHGNSDLERTDRSPANSAALDRPKRRRDQTNARLFDQALHSLSAGELDVALDHFKKLKDKLPQSKRLNAFIEAIEAVKTPVAEDATMDQGGMLEDFEGLLQEAVAYGRCPACFSMVAKKFTRCFACGFQLGR